MSFRNADDKCYSFKRVDAPINTEQPNLRRNQPIINNAIQISFNNAQQTFIEWENEYLVCLSPMCKLQSKTLIVKSDKSQENIRKHPHFSNVCCRKWILPVFSTVHQPKQGNNKTVDYPVIVDYEGSIGKAFHTKLPQLPVSKLIDSIQSSVHTLVQSSKIAYSSYAKSHHLWAQWIEELLLQIIGVIEQSGSDVASNIDCFLKNKNQRLGYCYPNDLHAGFNQPVGRYVIWDGRKMKEELQSVGQRIVNLRDQVLFRQQQLPSKRMDQFQELFCLFSITKTSSDLLKYTFTEEGDALVCEFCQQTISNSNMNNNHKLLLQHLQTSHFDISYKCYLSLRGCQHEQVSVQRVIFQLSKYSVLIVNDLTLCNEYQYQKQLKSMIKSNNQNQINSLQIDLLCKNLTSETFKRYLLLGNNREALQCIIILIHRAATIHKPVQVNTTIKSCRFRGFNGCNYKDDSI